MRLTNASLVCVLLGSGCGGYVGATRGELAGDASDGTGEDAGALDASVLREGGSALDAAALDAAVSDASRDAGASDASDGASARSEGCGMPATSDGTFSNLTLRVGDIDRSYHLRLPTPYDPARAYALVFRFHGYGGDGLAGGLGIEGPASADAIVVGPDGMNQAWTTASEAADLAFFDAMVEAVTERYCVDRTRVFSYGFSQGGGFTNLLACRRAEQLRATAAIAGIDRGAGTCARPVAAWFRHDQTDPSVDIAQGEAARDRAIARAHCSTASAPEGACVRYQDCDPGYPVVWCETAGEGHNIAGDTAPQAVWDFFRTLP